MAVLLKCSNPFILRTCIYCSAFLLLPVAPSLLPDDEPGLDAVDLDAEDLPMPELLFSLFDEVADEPAFLSEFWFAIV